MTFHCLARFHFLHALGSAGNVYHAEDLQLGRAVAVKLLPRSVCHDLRALEELKRTAAAIASLRHPHICAIEEVDERDGQHFIVMELLEGSTLREQLAAGPAPLAQILRVGIQAADALEAAHGAGILHGDLEPAKLFITKTGEIKLMDFCMRHVRGRPGWRAQAPPEKLSYAAPEELLERPTDARSDLFSLGIVLYEMATGRMPFSGTTPNLVADSILHRTPTRAADLAPHLPVAVEWAIHRCLEKHPQHRYQSASALRADLERVGVPATT